MNKIKKTAAAVLAAAIALTAAEPSYADTAAQTAAAAPKPSQAADTASDAKMLETAIRTIRERIDIPKEMSELTYTKNGRDSQNVYYSVQYREKADDGKGMSVNITTDGVITNYFKALNRDYSDENQLSFAKLPEPELKAKATAEFKKLNPTVASKFKVSSIDLRLSGNTATVSFDRVANSAPVGRDNASVTLNKDTGELESMYVSWTDRLPIKAETFVPVSAANAAYIKGATYEPYYNPYYDGENKLHVDILADVHNTPVNAVTGELSTFDEGMRNDYVGIETAVDDAEEDSVAGGAAPKRAYVLTPEEKKAVQQEKNLLSAEEAFAKAKADPYVGADDTYKISSSSFNERKPYDYNYQFQYVWSLTLTKTVDKKTADTINVTVDAAKGTIGGFNHYAHIPLQRADAPTAVSTVADRAPKADEVVNYYLKGKNYKFTDSSKETAKDSLINAAYYTYTREVNGLKVRPDTISVSVQPNGTVTSMSYTYHNVTFPEAKYLPKEQALAAYLKENPLTLSYVLRTRDGDRAAEAQYGDGSRQYSADGERSGGGVLDAKTGLSYKSYTENVSIKDTEYSDVKTGDRNYDIVNKLKQYGIGLAAKNGKLSPNAAVEKGELSALLWSVSQNNWNWYSSINREDKANVTKSDAVKMFVTAIGGERFAKLKGIYKTAYTDVKSADTGYFAIAKAVGALTESGKKISPDKKFTRMDALQLVYDYLTARSK